MGYIIKDGITVVEPKAITLSGVPNFVVFSGKSSDTIRSTRCQLSFISFPKNPDMDQLRLVMTIPHIYTGSIAGTLVESEVGERDRTGFLKYYYDASSMEATAHNIADAFLSFPEIKDRIDISVLPIFTEDGTLSGYTIYLNPRIPLDFDMYNNSYPEVKLIDISDVFVAEIPTDILLKIAGESEIKIDVYSGIGGSPGGNIPPDTPERVGTYLALLRKTYTGSPLWFNLSSLFSQYRTCNLPAAAGWFDTGTCRTYRFSAIAPVISEYPFYWSDVLYVLNGYGRASKPDNMEEYVYSGGSVKLLSDKPRTTYVRGQQEYINFILGNLVDASQRFGISYRAYTTSGALLGEIHGDEVSAEDLCTVNTCVLNIDALLDEFPNAGIVRVALTVNGEIVSDNLEYEVLPECLHRLKDFSFLNRFGGWSSINFEAGTKDEIKPSIETYDKTLTPSYGKGGSLETVYKTSLSQTFTIEGAPVTNDVAEWLKEFAASQVILDGDGNYIIIEDFTLPVSDDNYNMQKPTLKYRLSEPYD